MKKYWLINVSGTDGYSFMVRCKADSSDDVISMASEAGLFNDEEDTKEASCEEADEEDIKHFTEWGLIQEID